MKKILFFFILNIFIFACTSGKFIVANNHFNNGDYKKAIKIYNQILNNSKNKNQIFSAKLGLISSYIHLENFKKSLFIIKEMEDKVSNEFKEWILYNKIISEFNLKYYTEAYNDASIFGRNFKDSKHIQETEAIKKVAFKSLGKESNLINTDNSIYQKNSKTSITQSIIPIKLIIKDYYKDDYGYVNIIGLTEPNIKVMLNNKEFKSDKDGNFNDRIKIRYGQTIYVKAIKSKNSFSVKEIFDTEEPDAPEGLEIVNKTSSTVEIRWEPNSEKDILGYNIYVFCKSSGLMKWNKEDEIIKNTRYTLSGLNKDCIKEIRITALDKMRNESEPASIDPGF